MRSPSSHSGTLGLVAAAVPESRAAPADEFIKQLYQAHAVAMVRVAVLLLGDQPSAEDVVQEAFIALYRGLPRLRDRSKALPYLRASVVNGARSVLRSRKRAALRRVPYEPPVWSAESAAMVGEERRELLVAVAALPGRQREVLALRYYLDLNGNEIATALGISRGTVSSTASRALAALAQRRPQEILSPDPRHLPVGHRQADPLPADLPAARLPG